MANCFMAVVYYSLQCSSSCPRDSSQLGLWITATWSCRLPAITAVIYICIISIRVLQLYCCLRLSASDSCLCHRSRLSPLSPSLSILFTFSVLVLTLSFSVSHFLFHSLSLFPSVSDARSIPGGPGQTGRFFTCSILILTSPGYCGAFAGSDIDDMMYIIFISSISYMYKYVVNQNAHSYLVV